MADDGKYGSPQATGGGGPLGQPWLIWGLGVGAVVLYLWYRKRNAASASNSVLSNPNVSPMVDTGTGGLVDPLTGLPYLTSQAASSSSTQTLSGWITAAQNFLKNSGYAPSLIEQALYDFQNGNTLTNQESGVVNAALGGVGYPPNLLPFLGNIPNPQPPAPTPAPKPVPKPVPVNQKKGILPVPSGIKLNPGERFVGFTPSGGNGAGYWLTNLGGVFSVGGAQSYGSFLGLPAGTRKGIGNFTGLDILAGGGYTEIAQGGQRYTFTPTTLKQHVGVGP